MNLRTAGLLAPVFQRPLFHSVTASLMCPMWIFLSSGFQTRAPPFLIWTFTCIFLPVPLIQFFFFIVAMTCLPVEDDLLGVVPMATSRAVGFLLSPFGSTRLVGLFPA